MASRSMKKQHGRWWKEGCCPFPGDVVSFFGLKINERRTRDDAAKDCAEIFEICRVYDVKFGGFEGRSVAYLC